jgi:hypothetical protein
VLPAPRGPRSAHLLDHLTRPVHGLSPLPAGTGSPLTDGDAALALYLCYELHYLGLPGVDEAWEWEPSLLRERRTLEWELEAALQAMVGVPPMGMSLEQTIEELRRLAHAGSGPSLSAFMRDDGTLEQMRELAVHRSAYQLKEADPHTWAIPRLSGRAKAGLVDIQRGEYGDGVLDAVHANLFAAVLDELELRPEYGAYIDRLPGIALTTCNLVSLFGLHRRWRGALVGHLALFEMSSVGPMGRYRDALVRLGLGERATRFYEEHVVADARHQDVALDEMVRGLLEQEPFLAGEVVFGARALATVERVFSEHVLSRWAEGRSSLLPPLR